MGRAFSPEELGIVQASLAELTSFYQQDSESVGLLLQVGRAPVAEGSIELNWLRGRWLSIN